MRLGEMGEFYGVEGLEREFFEGNWGGEVWYDCGVGFVWWGEMALGWGFGVM